MAFKDLREYIEVLDKNGELVHIREQVNWELELGTIMRRGAEIGAPACLFENIKDYPGYRILGNSVASWRRLSLAFGISPNSTIKEIQRAYEMRMEKPLKPRVVKSGPCKENVVLGDKVDLFQFPIPLEHEGDGNRCIGSWHAVIVKDSDSDWTNWGMYRQMVHNRHYIGGHWHAATDAARILYSKYAPYGKPMPVAIAIGIDPLCTLAAVAPLPMGVSEVDYAGGFREEPVELVKCETSDLLVPANAEIIIEGEILPDRRVPDGPFGDFTVHEVVGPNKHPCKVNAITYRNDPILTVSHLGIGMDDNYFMPFTAAIPIKKLLKERGVPVVDVNVPIEGMGLLAIVSVKNKYPTVADHVASVMDSRQPEFVHATVVVDEDVNVFNGLEILHSLLTKMHPGRNIKVNSRLVVSLLNYLSPEERGKPEDALAKGASVMFDCTTPAEWIEKHGVLQRNFFRDISPEIREKVVAKWEQYGFKK